VSKTALSFFKSVMVKHELVHVGLLEL
jgi:hypothetical protein